MSSDEDRKKKQLESLKQKRWTEYKKWSKCHCPALNAEVHFTVDGFFHLHTDPSGRIRTVSEQLHKYSNLIFVPEVIKNCPGILTYRKVTAPLGRGRKKSGKLLIKEFEYWSLKSKIKNMDVKVILRKLANSTKIIFSRLRHFSQNL